ncbi:MAG: hypothetical protein K9J37_23305 [Saprospiraceae bacterium]|nr:hypothetical protein [Saprospiraceae bacterium]MCF8252854.1 hypothetical protein [Saprospiraceae bacterium]MCF8283309.1 hypothetical protein [Bacteroidales bacterium]MCF8314406.1 hypothetical protein [Saprospiraceae bacterium]MCF8443296.1 hypothetical protein [Saprospiraceae bacterium]
MQPLLIASVSRFLFDFLFIGSQFCQFLLLEIDAEGLFLLGGQCARCAKSSTFPAQQHLNNLR